MLDHAAIYLLIAGTYTPFMIDALRGPWGWTMFGVVWGLAVAGVGLKLVFTGRFRLLSTLVYVGMGWMALIAVGPMLRNLDPATLAWLLAGGIAYTAGTPFYHNARLRWSHPVWHLFVVRTPRRRELQEQRGMQSSTGMRTVSANDPYAADTDDELATSGAWTQPRHQPLNDPLSFRKIS